MEFGLKKFAEPGEDADVAASNMPSNAFQERGTLADYNHDLGSPEYNEVQTVLADGGHRFGVSAVAFDLQEELLWMGNQGGHVTSYYGMGMQKYTSFQVHATNEVRQILSINSGVLSLTSNSLRCQSRQGIPVFTYSTEAMQDMQCMLLSENNSLLMGGHQEQLLEIDLNQMEEIQQLDVGEHGCAILRQHPRFLCCGDVSGKITLRDPKTYRAEHVLDAHTGTLSDFDIHGNLLITCGFSSRLGNLSVDRFLMVYDLRVMRAVAPIQLMLDPLLLRFVPTFTSRIAVVSQTGQFQLVETGALTSSSMYLYHFNSEGSLCLTFDVSSTCQALAFGDTGGYIHLFCNAPEMTFNPFSKPTEFADPVEPLPAISIDDELSPLSTVPLPFCTRRLLSDLPPQYCKVTYRRASNVDPEILKTMKLVQSIGYAPNPGNRRRNQIPYKSVDKNGRRSTALDASHGIGEDPYVKIPKKYRKVEVKYSKLGIEDFDFDHYNRTCFAGLEASLTNSYCNAMLQVLYFIGPLRSALLNHCCRNEFCMACELNFLFHMLDISKGMPCQASNFLRAFRTIPEAAALDLILNEADEAKNKQNLIRIIQSWNRFILQQLHSETVEILDDRLDDGETTGGEFDSSHQSIISRLFGTELFTCHRCRCSREKFVDSTTLLFSLTYPNSLKGSNKTTDQTSFGQLLTKSLCLEQTTHAWCEQCEKYQPTVQSRRLKNLPAILSINCGFDSPKDLTFWKTQTEMEQTMPGHNFMMFSKPCRFGTACTKKDCKFQHPWTDKSNEGQSGTAEVQPGSKLTSWLPPGLRIVRSDDGQVDVTEMSNPAKMKETACGKDDHTYRLISVVCHVKDTKQGRSNNNLVACLRVGPGYHLRSMGSAGNQWYIFNDFTVTPVSQEEAVRFNFDWKIPCSLFYARMDLEEKHLVEAVNPITADVFLEDKTLVTRMNHQSITFTPLGVSEMLQKGDIVAVDAEFVTLNQEETVIRSDGTRSTIKPSHMSVARITCVRGQGLLEGVPFIDDYISTQEQVVDYLTKFSGIKPGDLDATISSKHLTTLKSMYLKLRYLVDCGIIFVGHGLKNDFRVINLVVPAEQVIDTVLLFHRPHQRMIALRFLAWHFLGLKIQSVTHDSIEDARTALKLYHCYEALRGENRVNEALKELYENGRNLQWKVPETED